MSLVSREKIFLTSASKLQTAEQKRMKPLIEAVIAELCSSTSTLVPGKMVIVDMGCSTGPNALTLVSIAVKAVQDHCFQVQQPPPEVCLLLNDLPNNDFNTVVKSLVMLRQSNEHVVVTGITPGSFYERLYTSGSLHLVCSSNSLHWLSKAPEDLFKNHIPAYDMDKDARRQRHRIVLEAYAKQFRKDFTNFLKLRAKELVSKGRMVVSLVGRRSDVTATKFSYLSRTISQILSVMVSEGVIDKETFDSFYVPVYEPSSKEVREIIKEEGSFSIREMQVHDPTTDMNNALSTPSKFVNLLRALCEPILVQHFGDVMYEFVSTAERHWSMEGNLLGPYAMLAISLAKA
ncbi:unnamed protein product [Triticum turgidum subsp. durum]|uniref:Jasmonate O-methyltransferase n=1 Tax=Triticum turgidum subsp. durum TaxID=4567 RepID=A0A9R1QV55_TRITD|nr:unnamed protein product [Triticum turgidum subsp. durum]